MTIQEIRDNLDTLFDDEDIIKILNKINRNYKNMSYSERKKIIFEFSEIASSILDSFATTSINHESESNHEYSDVVLSDYHDGIVINGVDKNPYIYIKDILFYHLVIANEDEIETIYVGDVNYCSDYTSVAPFIASYSKENIKYKELVLTKLNEILECIDNDYKDEYVRTLDNNMSEEMIGDFIHVNELYDAFTKEDKYEEILKIKKVITSNLSKKEITSKKLLAMYAVDNILNQALKEGEYEVIKKNLNTFIYTFFKEFATLINVEIENRQIKVNDIVVKSDDMFMDVILTAIGKINKTYDITSLVVAPSKKENIEKLLNKKLSDLEAYFYTKLYEIDKQLENKNLEIVGYARFTDIYKYEDDIDIYIDDNRIFEELFENEEFVNLCNDIVSSKKIDKKVTLKLASLINIMNKVYNNADFNLITNFDAHANSELGSSDEDTIYLNLAYLYKGEDVLSTFFHEYRHLTQVRELKNNSGIYNDTIYSYIEKQYKESPFGGSYGYCTYAEAGYRSDINYDLQPIEFDAENFAKYMFSRLASLNGSKVKMSNVVFNSQYNKKYNYFSNKKISLKYYDYYYKLNQIDETLKKEEESYKELMQVIINIDNYEPEEIFVMDNFDELEFIYKKEVYKKILLNKSALLIKDEDNISINGRTYKLNDIDSYFILEQVLIANAIHLAKKGELKMIDVNKYIYNEALKYKIDRNKYDEYNLYRCHSFYHTFNKYNIKNNNKKKVKSK